MGLNYPKSSLKKVLELTEAVDRLGGECSREACADKLGRKQSGSFRDIIAAAKKYGLLRTSKGSLQTSNLFKDYRLSTTDVEEENFLRKSFLNVPLFDDLYEHYKQTELPKKSTLKKELEKSFNVKRSHASRIAGHFEKGAKKVGLMNGDRSFNGHTEVEDTDDGQSTNNSADKANDDSFDEHLKADNDGFSVHFTGPGMDATYEIIEEEDFTIIEATLSKIKKKI